MFPNIANAPHKDYILCRLTYVVYSFYISAVRFWPSRERGKLKQNISGLTQESKEEQMVISEWSTKIK